MSASLYCHCIVHKISPQFNPVVAVPWLSQARNTHHQEHQPRQNDCYTIRSTTFNRNAKRHNDSNVGRKNCYRQSRDIHKNPGERNRSKREHRSVPPSPLHLPRHFSVCRLVCRWFGCLWFGCLWCPLGSRGAGDEKASRRWISAPHLDIANSKVS